MKAHPINIAPTTNPKLTPWGFRFSVMIHHAYPVLKPSTGVANSDNQPESGRRCPRNDERHPPTRRYRREQSNARPEASQPPARPKRRALPTVDLTIQPYRPKTASGQKKYTPGDLPLDSPTAP